ncbi:MAG TPA: enolase C-terminal domain-like protein, partial [Nannocystaceae bacterium]|nr:enolase C-terminal domain-like protein [Nannocystaceae bacterium]
ATMLHMGAVVPNLGYAADAHHHHLTDDAIAGRLMRYEDGATREPEAPGLGVTLDRDRMARYHELFREPGGPGWALCGDAYHQKDSIDAQGIYDALLGAKELAAQVVRWHRGELTWEAAVAAYGASIYAACKPMFDATMRRLAREIYSVPPPAAAKTLMRWMLTNPAYGRRFAALVTRQLDPAAFLTPPLALSLVAGGALQRLRRRLRGGDPTDALPV